MTVKVYPYVWRVFTRAALSFFFATGSIFGIMAVVASLTKAGEVQEAACLRSLVEYVGARQNDNASRGWVGFVVLCAAPLTAIFSADMDHEIASQWPVFWVSGAVFRLDRHVGAFW